MIQSIGIETLRILVEEPDMIVDRHEEVKEILSNVLEYEDSEEYQRQPISVFSNTEQNPQRYKEDETESKLTESSSPHLDMVKTGATDVDQVLLSSREDPAPLPDPVKLPDTPTSEITIPPISPDELPARALYKNFNGLAIKERFAERTDDTPLQVRLTNYALVNESEEQVELVDIENERYITVTEERLQLHARSEAELTIAMAEVEAQCTSAVMYLAKTIEERGESHATE